MEEHKANIDTLQEQVKGQRERFLLVKWFVCEFYSKEKVRKLTRNRGGAEVEGGGVVETIGR